MRTAPLLISLLFATALVGCGPDGIDEPNAAFEQSAAAEDGGGVGIEVISAPVDAHADDDVLEDATDGTMHAEADAHDDAIDDAMPAEAGAHDDAIDDAMPAEADEHDDATDDATHAEATPAAPTAIVIDVEMVEFGYVMDTDAVPMGEPLTFRFTNSGNIEHEAMFGSAHQQEEYASTGGHEDGHGGGHHGDIAAVTLAPGETAELVLSFEEAGEMWVGCHIAGHWDAGMFTPFSVDA